MCPVRPDGLVARDGMQAVRLVFLEFGMDGRCPTYVHCHMHLCDVVEPGGLLTGSLSCSRLKVVDAFSIYRSE